jgi:hypothetical protein
MIAGLAASTLICAATAQAATQVETLQAAVPVAAYDGTAMWSRLDAATGRYQLVQAVDGGSPTVVAVPERNGPFDIDLGSNRGGSTYAVYSRGGDIYRLNPRTAVEAKLTGLSAPGLAERDPTIERGRIAFIRRTRGRDELRIGDTTTGSKGTRRLLRQNSIQSIELGVSQIAYVDRAGNQQRVHIRNISTGRDHVVYSAGSGGASFTVVTRPSFTDDLTGFIWARSILGTTGSRIVKYTLHTGKLSYAEGSPRDASVAWVSDALGAVVSTSIDAGTGSAGECSDAGVQYCSIQYIGPLSFDLQRLASPTAR